jgi:DNA-binding PucR family transcriptional regulator
MLLLGHLGAEDAAAAARRIGWPPGASRAAIAVAIRDSSPKAGSRTQRRHLAAVLREADRTELPAAMIDGVLVLVAESVDDVAVLLREADLTSDAVALGLGTPTSEPDRIPRSHREALWAARTAIDEGVPLVDFTDTGLHRLFLPGHEGGDPKFERPVVQLEASADQCSFDPIETLTAYLDAGGNASRAAGDLHLHLNSLRYRLQRIGEICEVDLGDPEVRFQLQLALRLRRTRRALHDAVPETFR